MNNLFPMTMENLARLDILLFIFYIAMMTCAVILISTGIGSLVGTIIHRINNRGGYRRICR